MVKVGNMQLPFGIVLLSLIAVSHLPASLAFRRYGLLQVVQYKGHNLCRSRQSRLSCRWRLQWAISFATRHRRGSVKLLWQGHAPFSEGGPHWDIWSSLPNSLMF